MKKKFRENSLVSDLPQAAATRLAIKWVSEEAKTVINSWYMLAPSTNIQAKAEITK